MLGVIKYDARPDPVLMALYPPTSSGPRLPGIDDAKGQQTDGVISNARLSQCNHCRNLPFWIDREIIYPHTGSAPPANPDMPDDIRRDYDEASSILDLSPRGAAFSPRGAAALIRLAIQKLCKELGQPGKNINDNIGALVRGGLDVRVQRALDAVRVIGNSAVHPGQIDLRDDRTTAETLFRLLNLIVDKLISEPKEIDAVYDNLPAGALEAIRRRDDQSCP